MNSQTVGSSLDALYSEALEHIGHGALEPMKLLGVAEQLGSSGRQQDAVKLYQYWLSNCSSQVNYVVMFNMGVAMTQMGDLQGAEKAYRDAIFQKPDFIQAWFNLGSALEQQGRADNALVIWQSMLDHPLVGPELNTDMYVMVLNSMGRLLEENRRYDEAEAKMHASLVTQPQQSKVIQHWVHLRQKQCKWPAYAEIPGLSYGEMLKATSPLAMLAVSGDPGLQLAASTRFIRERVNLRVPALAPAQGYKHDRIRIGFLSSDLSMHAVSQLTVELFELLDRADFEVYGFCWSKEDGTQFRSRVVKAFDHFVRIAGLDDGAAAQAILSHEIDVLVDLHGLTSGARPNILSYRAAPVQVTYLGFAGTIGHPCVDYVVADRFLIPDAEAPYYSETPLYLDEVYQCSDRQRPVARLPSRAECGLPEDKFVFCSHNNNYKFNDEVFSCWMRILHAVPESVLWLLEDNQWAQASLRKYAEQHGVEPGRLIFAPRAAPPEYLARFSAADLFLDTYPCNAGATANDVLYMSLPLLTRSGRTFASRMAGSLLTSMGLQELITYDIAEYEKQAIHLASHPKVFAKLKAKVVDARKHSPLFDMPRFVKNFEAAIKQKVISAK